METAIQVYDSLPASVDTTTGEIVTPEPAEGGVSFQANPYVGIAAQPFSAEAREILTAVIADDQVEIRPDGLVYLPEIRYRRILNRAFGPGAWALMPRNIDLGDNMLYYRGALFVHGRFVSEAIGEQQYFPNNDRMSYATAAEAAKSNCLVRCCKDLGIASELWDPVFTQRWLGTYAEEVWCQNRQQQEKKKKFWRKRGGPPTWTWPWVEMEEGGQSGKHASAPPQDQPAAAPQSASAERSAPPPTSGQGGDLQKRLISPKQAGRFRAISRVHNWRDRELGRLLALHRFASVEEITRDAYEELCDLLVNPETLTNIRREIDQEDVAGDVLENLLQ